jgi:hypothetical protein
VSAEWSLVWVPSCLVRSLSCQSPGPGEDFPAKGALKQRPFPRPTASPRSRPSRARDLFFAQGLWTAPPATDHRNISRQSCTSPENDWWNPVGPAENEPRLCPSLREALRANHSEDERLGAPPNGEQMHTRRCCLPNHEAGRENCDPRLPQAAGRWGGGKWAQAYPSCGWA